MSYVGDVGSTPCSQLAVAPMSTTELIKMQLEQYITEIQRWQMSLCRSSSTGAGAVSSGSVFSGDIGGSESLRFWELYNNMRSS